MLRKELLIGYVVAGFLAVMVPAQWWNALFLHGHGFWTSVENALVGPLIAVISWVCSIGNVPLAAALWSGGISFGGVIAFVFADLIAMPLILIYLKFYGSKLTIRLVATFYVLMAIAGLVTQLIFASLGAVPRTRPVSIAPAHFSWNYTSYLNIAFLILATIVWWLAKNRQRFGGGEGYAIDPVCGMQVRTADAPATVRHDNTIFYFCADRCRERFEADPTRWSTGNAPTEAMDAESNVIDPVCGMVVDPEHAAAHRHHEGSDFWFCAASCAERFDEDPDRFSGESPTYEAMTVPEPVMMTMSRKPAQATAVDPVCGMTIDPEHAAMTITHDGVAYFFCNPGCGERFSADPSTYLGAKRHP